MFAGRLGQVVAVVVAALIGAAATFVLIRWQPEPEPVLVPIDPQATTCDRAFAAADDISAYLEERAESDPAVLAHPLSDVAEGEQDAAWEEYIAETGQYMRETVSGFETTFGGEVQYLVEQFAQAGAWGEDLPTEVIVVNEIGIRNLATNLDSAALRAGCGP